MPAPVLFEILEESDDFLVVNKPGGLVCHPTKGDAYSSLIGRLRLYYQNQPGVKPSFVNRLDRETSGVVLIAKHSSAHRDLQRAFDRRQAAKRYLAVVEGIPLADSGTVDQPMGREPGSSVTVKQAVLPEGALSVTHWRKLEEGKDATLLEVRPETGRLHQIRVHLSFIGHPVVGDKIYGPDPLLYLEFAKNGWKPEMKKLLRTQRQMLHAAELGIPEDDEDRILQRAGGLALPGKVRTGVRSWKAPMPEDMCGFLAECGISIS